MKTIEVTEKLKHLLKEIPLSADEEFWQKVQDSRVHMALRSAIDLIEEQSKELDAKEATLAVLSAQVAALSRKCIYDCPYRSGAPGGVTIIDFE